MSLIKTGNGSRRLQEPGLLSHRLKRSWGIITRWWQVMWKVLNIGYMAVPGIIMEKKACWKLNMGIKQGYSRRYKRILNQVQHRLLAPEWGLRGAGIRCDKTFNSFLHTKEVSLSYLYDK